MSPGSGSSTLGSRWVASRIFLSGRPSARSSATTDGCRPTTNGAIMCGKTTMSRSGTTGSSLGSRSFFMFSTRMGFLDV